MTGQSVSDFMDFCIYDGRRCRENVKRGRFVGRRCRENVKGGLYEFSTLCRRADKQGRAFL